MCDNNNIFNKILKKKNDRKGNCAQCARIRWKPDRRRRREVKIKLHCRRSAHDGKCIQNAGGADQASRIIRWTRDHHKKTVHIAASVRAITHFIRRDDDATRVQINAFNTNTAYQREVYKTFVELLSRLLSRELQSGGNTIMHHTRAYRASHEIHNNHKVL